MEWVVSQSQVFGGCCCNVYLFEKLLSGALPKNTDVGAVVTLCQFVLVAAVSWWLLLDVSPLAWRRGFVRKTAIPLPKILCSVLMFFAVLVINNSVWKYGLSVPVHIMFRSSSTVVTMLVSRVVAGRRYTRGQVVLSVLMSVGIVLVILQNEHSGEGTQLSVRFCCGVALLTLASVLSAFLGLYTELLYRQYGNHWREMIFYNHVMGIPMFAAMGKTIARDFLAMWNAQPKYVLLREPHVAVLSPFMYLVLNAVTQVICARGVNSLTGFASSLTVTVVLTLRKFVSLALSAYIFGTRFTRQGVVGSVVLLAGSVLYSVTTMKAAKRKTE